MSHDVAEGRIAVAAQEKYGVVIQHGTQRRSDAKTAGLHEAIRAGRWGKLKVSYGYCCKERASIGHKPVTDPPSNLIGISGVVRLLSSSSMQTTCITTGTGLEHRQWRLE